MEFGILGSVVVMRDGQALDLGRPKQRAVLARLLIDVDRVVSLDRFAEMFWSDVTPRQAAASLQTYISNLRRTLEPERPNGAAPNVLLTQPPGYRLRADSGQLDSARFEALAESGQRLLGTGRPGPARNDLVEALAYWRGPALAEFAGEPFARVEAARLEELRAVAVEDRVDADLALGGHSAVVPELEALLHEYPLRERLWGLLMVALYRSGRQAEALRSFAAARRMLADELGIAPGPALRRLESDILGQATSLDWHPAAYDRGGRAPRLIDAVAIEPPVTIARTETAGLVGRQAEIGQLDAALSAALVGRGSLALIAGEPGIGKTRLAEELATRGASQAVGVAWGRCHDGQGAPPYWPWVQVLEKVMADRDDELVLRALGSRANAIAQIVPAVKELVHDVAPPPLTDGAAARFHLHQAVTGFLADLSAQAAMLLILDDINWADVASLELLRTVAEQLPSMAVLLVATYRTVDAGNTETLTDLLGELARDGVERILLGGLDRTDVARLMANATGSAATPLAAASVHARTEGNPFFVTELARLLASESLREPGSNQPAAVPQVPAGVRDVIRRRVGRLPKRTGDLLSIAALIGRDFDLSLLAAAAGVDPVGALDAIDTALAAGIVVEAPTAVGHYRFSHALVQETLYHGVSALRRARLNAQVGQTIEAGPSPASRLPQLAYHFHEAAPVAGPGKGISYAMAAAEEAQLTLAYETAENHLRRALDLTKSVPDRLERDRIELDVQGNLARLLTMVKGVMAPDARLCWQRAMELCSEVHDRRRLLGSLWGVFVISYIRTDFQSAGALAETMTTLGADDPGIAAAAHLAAGGVDLFCGNLRESVKHLEQARRLIDSSPGVDFSDLVYVDLPASVEGYAGMALCLAGRESEGRSASGGALRRMRALGEPFSLALAVHFDAMSLLFVRDAEGVRQRAEENAALAEKHRLPDFDVTSKLLTGWAMSQQGTPALGASMAREAMAVMRPTSQTLSRTVYLAIVAESEHLAGNHQESLDVLGEALDVAGTNGERIYQAEIHRLRGRVLAVLGPDRSDEAAASFSLAVALATAQGTVPFLQRAQDDLKRHRATRVDCPAVVPGG